MSAVAAGFYRTQMEIGSMPTDDLRLMVAKRLLATFSNTITVPGSDPILWKDYSPGLQRGWLALADAILPLLELPAAWESEGDVTLSRAYFDRFTQARQKFLGAAD